MMSRLDMYCIRPGASCSGAADCASRGAGHAPSDGCSLRHYAHWRGHLIALAAEEIVMLQEHPVIGPPIDRSSDIPARSMIHGVVEQKKSRFSGSTTRRSSWPIVGARAIAQVKASRGRSPARRLLREEGRRAGGKSFVRHMDARLSIFPRPTRS